ncbi:tape measure protein [Limosilactobacillus mucosae]|uniref:tape measure protein n=2 Tax=Limosilactobacillus mucosae TaxID=97478 RepID=UPI0015D54F9C|nr:tape measure protein [Limosilactobacillus mucosae]QLI94483.1 tape measure protein [Limosilactobacillus mucosae]
MAQEMSIEAILSAVDQNFTKTMESAVDSLSKVVSQSNQTASATTSATSSVKNLATSLGLVAVASKAFNVVKDSIGGAIDRFDTLNKYPVVMDALGYSARDVAKSSKLMQKGIDGLPTSLQDITSVAQQLAPLTGSATKASKSALALNNAFLASGASVADTSRGLQQYTQMLSTGKVDMMSYRTLMETMPIALRKVANAFGFTGKSAEQDLFNALQSGKISVDQLNDKFIELNKGQNGFAQLAKKNSAGIATSFANLKASVVKNLGNMLTAINNGFSKAGFGSIAQVLDNMKVGINGAFTAITPIVTQATTVILNSLKSMFDFINANKDWLTPLVIGIGAFVGQMILLKKTVSFVNSAKTAIAEFQAIMNTMSFDNVFKSFGGLKMVAIAAIIAIVAALVYFFTQTEKGRQMWQSFVSWLSNAWQTLSTIATSVWGKISDVVSVACNTVKNVLGGVSQTIQGFITKMGGIGGIASMIVSTLTKIGLAALGISGPWGLAAGAVISFVTAWLQTGQLNADGITQVFDQLSNTITNVTNAIVANIPLIVGMITNVIVGIANSISENLPQIIAIGTQIITSLTTAITAALPLLIVAGVQILIALINTIVASLPMIITAGLQIIMALANAIVTVLPMLITAGVQIIMALANAIISNLPQIIEAGVEILTALINGIAQVLPLLVVSALRIIVVLAEAIISNLPQIIAAGVQIIAALIKGILQMIGSLGSAMAQVGREIINSVAHIDLSANGKAIMNSLLGGLKSAWESVKSFVGGIGKWIKAHKGPISVDRRLLIPAGHAIMNGLGNGLVDGFSDVQKSVLAMNKQIADAMQPDVSGFANRLNGMASDVQSRFAGSLTMQDSTLQMQNNALLRQIAGKDTTMILDSGVLVGATAGSYDQRLGQRTALKDRWS